ncbi:MAG: Uncharacterised protein [Formosa sp. Hel3_A1_48]|jgi:hypothetical protein|nr:MAG: Uncharacterised protein [Formosa sp. Hel3_A1_48]
MKKLITLMSLAVVGLAFGQEEEPKFNVTGSVDAYYSNSLNGPNDQSTIATDEFGDVLGFTAPPSALMGNDDRAFSGANANVKFSYEGEKVGFVADLAYGPRADAQFYDFGVVNEAYVYWNASEKVTLMMGRWNSWMGYENFAAADNFHYSYSHQYTFGPRNFNGFAMQYALGNDFNLGVAVMNPVETTVRNTSEEYSFAAGLSKGNFGISFLTSEDETFIDVKAKVNFSDSFSVDLNANLASWDEDATLTGTRALLTDSEGYTSISAYTQVQSTDSFAWGIRLEYFNIIGDDSEDDLNVITPTLTGNYSVGDLTIRPELRFDAASEDIFLNSDMDGDQGGLASFTLAAIYSF